MYKDKPVIGLTSSFENKQDAPKVFLPQAYLDAIRQFGGIPLLIPVCASDEERALLLDQCDGLVLTGGDDIEPERYSESVWNDTVEPAPERDSAEWKVCAMALERNIPILGICRGFQLLNVFFGGSLYQDLPTQFTSDISHRMEKPDHRTCHDCVVEPGSALHRLISERIIGVNSHHHQAVKALAPGLQVMARATDGLIEAFCRMDGPFCWGVQWHPEKIWDIAPSSGMIFEAFLDACKQ